MVDVLFAFAISAGGYTEFCRTNECKPSAIVMVEPSEHVRRDRHGWYHQGTSYVKIGRDEVFTNATKVHEYVHHLQRLSNRFHGYRGICNQYGAELEAHTVGNAYLLTKGWKYDVERAVVSYKSKCEAAVAAGLVVRPNWMAQQPSVEKHTVVR